MIIPGQGSIKIADTELSSPVMNAACSLAKTFEDVEAFCKTKSSAVVVGSITLEPREGNQEPRWYDAGEYALNSFGMPNRGMEYYKTALPKMAKRVRDADKAFIVSIAGFSVNDYVQLAQMVNETGIDILELNFGCPNIQKQGRIISFDSELMREILTSVAKVTRLPLMLKLSPYSDPIQLREIARMIATHDTVAAVVTSNSFPNGYMSQDGKDLIASSYAGMNGRALLPIGLGQVRQFREHLPERVAVVGVGGIESPEDVKKYLNAGASAVQVASHLVRNGHQAIDQLVVSQC